MNLLRSVEIDEGELSISKARHQMMAQYHLRVLSSDSFVVVCHYLLLFVGVCQSVFVVISYYLLSSINNC